MADTKNPSDFSEEQDIRSRFQERVSGIGHDVLERFQDNKALMWTGIALLGVGVGFGVWALVRYFSENDEISTYVREEFSDAGTV